MALILALVFVAVLLATLGVWLLVGNRESASDRIQMRLKGVRQIKDYELGESLAVAEEKKKQAREKRKNITRKKAFSDIPVLENRFGAKPWAEKLSAQLRQAQMPLTVTAFLLICVAAGGVGALLTVALHSKPHALLTPLGFLMFAVAPYLYLTIAVSTRIKRFGLQFPDALDLLSSSVKSGQALNAAIQNVAEEMPDPVGDEFKIISDELTFGVEMADALRHLSHRVDTSDVQFFCTALLIQKETGGNLSEVLDGLQKTIRERFRILRQVKVLTAQGRLSGWILSALPIGLGIILAICNWGYMKHLFTTKDGQTLLIVAAVLELIGMVLIRKIVNIKV